MNMLNCDIKGGRGKCNKCGQYFNNVSLHESLCDNDLVVFQTSTETPIHSDESLENVLSIYYKWDEYTERVWISTFIDNGFDIESGDLCLIHKSWKSKLSPIPKRFDKQIIYSDYVDDGTSMIFMKPFDMTGYGLMPKSSS